jgi:hypothetical protein
VCGPNLKNKGLISEDRNNKATLLLTIPRSVFKSSAKDLIPPEYLELRFRVNGSGQGNESPHHTASTPKVRFKGRTPILNRLNIGGPITITVRQAWILT